MGKLKFSDGIEFETSGAFRVETRHDGHYVVGRGFLIPVMSEDEGREKIKDLVRKEVNNE